LQVWRFHAPVSRVFTFYALLQPHALILGLDYPLLSCMLRLQNQSFPMRISQYNEASSKGFLQKNIIFRNFFHDIYRLLFKKLKWYLLAIILTGLLDLWLSIPIGSFQADTDAMRKAPPLAERSQMPYALYRFSSNVP
jgi:hypothetical protein